MCKNNSLLYISWPDSNHKISVHTYMCSEKVLPHAHEFYELVFISKGSAVHHYKGKSTVLIPGDCFIIPPHCEHSFDIHSKTLKYNCLFYPEAFGAEWDTSFISEGIRDLLIESPSEDYTFIHLNPTQKSFFESLLNKLCNEIKYNFSHCDFILKACFMQLLGELVRAKENIYLNQSTFIHQRALLPSILEYIEQNYSSPLSISDLAKKAHLSESYFREIFKQYVGMPPTTFINKLRIDQAHYLLVNEGYSVTAAANAVGIYDSNYFSRLYKKTLGYCPSNIS